jgi:hypothetical protein
MTVANQGCNTLIMTIIIKIRFLEKIVSTETLWTTLMSNIVLTVYCETFSRI